MSGAVLPSTDGGTLARIGIQFPDDSARDHSSWADNDK
jgi:hypothetical protein